MLHQLYLVHHLKLISQYLEILTVEYPTSLLKKETFKRCYAVKEKDIGEAYNTGHQLAVAGTEENSEEV